MSLILTQLLNVADLGLNMPKVAGWRALYPRKMCAEHKIVSFVQELDSHQAFFSFFIHEDCLYARLFNLAYRTIHGKRKNSVLYVVNIIGGQTKSFDWGIMGCLLLEASKLLSMFSVNVILIFFFLYDPALYCENCKMY